MKVDLFIPCFVDQLFPETGFNMVKVLEKFNCEVQYNNQQTCCGQPAFNSGYWDEAKAIGRKFLKDFSGTDHYIVAPSGSCTGYVRNYYQKLFENSAEHNDYKKVKVQLFEFTEFLVNVLHVTDVGASLHTRATYHDGCGTLRECGVKQQPRQLLEQVKGLELTEMKECETCCGFGGAFAVKYEPISTGMAYTKVQSAVAAGAQCLISTDLSCLMHIDTYIRKHNVDLKTMHIADVLASGW
ncbi:(Fe-S)-binding protein [Taibaiella chishuiensis]|uniref:L-lactate dehydrogenase complex protein LldE n=1 Tax=Taibaiella chishuiensis TaxID=1434707 RepID=A0A2P8CV66_9BACT|nr:(Fe-S)-binding protein [Taibaiella chishuiensis]PSK88855.1 L-lactate dehydrogenase complex protein LldE [Taibaiella chishuiensis]